MSYADMITLLFMLFAVYVSLSASKHDHARPAGEPPHPWVTEHFGMLPLGLPHDTIYASLTGIVFSNHADQSIAVEKTPRGVLLDLSAVQFFGYRSADIPADQLPLIKNIVHEFKTSMLPGDTIEVEAYTDNAPLENSPFANNWELSAMRAALPAS